MYVSPTRDNRPAAEYRGEKQSALCVAWNWLNEDSEKRYRKDYERLLGSQEIRLLYLRAQYKMHNSPPKCPHAMLMKHGGRNECLLGIYFLVWQQFE